MGVVVRCREWEPGAAATDPYDVEMPTRRATLRSLIERRVRRQLEAKRLGRRGHPTASDDAAIADALAAYAAGRLLVLTANRRLESLDEIVELKAGEELTFLQLRPLASG